MLPTGSGTTKSKSLNSTSPPPCLPHPPGKCLTSEWDGHMPISISRNLAAMEPTHYVSATFSCSLSVLHVVTQSILLLLIVICIISL